MSHYTILLLFFFQIGYSQDLLLKNVNVIPMTKDTILKNMDVYITEGKIDKIVPGKIKLLYAGYPEIDAKDKYLIPGLIDMHAHFPDSSSTFYLNDYLKLNLAAGVTCLRSMRGLESQLALRDSIKKHQKLGPDISVSFVFPQDSTLSKDKICDLVYDAKIKRYDFIKYLGGLNSKRIGFLSENCHEYRIDLAGHAFNRSLSESIDLYYFKSVEHYQPFLAEYENGKEAFQKILRFMKDRNSGACPTLSFYYTYTFIYTLEQLQKRNGMQYVNQATKDAWQKEYEEAFNSTKEHFKDEMEIKYILANKIKFENFNTVLKVMNDAKVPLLLSADEGPFNVPGFSMLEEMRLYSKAGLSNYDILRAATVNASYVLNWERRFGTIEEKKEGSLVLLNGNPLEDIENVSKIEGLILNGKFYSQASLLGN